MWMIGPSGPQQRPEASAHTVPTNFATSTRHEQNLAAAAAEAAQKRGELDMETAKARERDHVQILKGTKPQVWGAERSESNLDWQAWTVVVASREVHIDALPPPRLGGERIREEEQWELHTQASRVKQRPRAADVEACRESTVPMKLGAPRTLPIQQVNKLLRTRGETFVEKLEATSQR